LVNDGFLFQGILDLLDKSSNVLKDWKKIDLHLSENLFNFLIIEFQLPKYPLAIYSNRWHSAESIEHSDKTESKIAHGS
jgi:hypothetical protein